MIQAIEDELTAFEESREMRNVTPVGRISYREKGSSPGAIEPQLDETSNCSYFEQQPAEAPLLPSATFSHPAIQLTIT